MAGHRIILLGASNLKRSFPMAVRVMQQSLAPPYDFHVAMGYGRSYGQSAGYLGKKFSGIFSSSIWHSLNEVDGARSLAFLTDVGNDLGYEVDVETIVEWVEGCVERLQRCGARVVVTSLPIESLSRLSEARFTFFRTLLFPFSRLTRPRLLAQAEALDEGLRRLAQSKKIPIFSVPNAWYGFDPIHVRRVYWRAFWEQQLGCLSARDALNRAPSENLWLSAYLGRLNSPSGRQASRASGTSATPIVLHDGTRLTFY